MGGVVLWLGPISTADIEGHVPDGWSIQTHNHGEGGASGSAAFATWAASLGPDPLSALAPGAAHVILAGFSAAHGAHEVILGRAAAARDPRLVGLLAADAYYTATAPAPPKPGHLAWCTQAAKDGRPAWFTTSSRAGNGYASASASFAPFAAALRLGPSRPPRGMPPPVRSFSRGSVRWLDYELLYKHEEHARVLAPMALDAWDRPAPTEGAQPPQAGLVVALLAALVRWVRR